MNWSTRKKVLYFLLFLIVMAVLIGVPFLVLTYEKPNCFDRKQNQREDGVDCGGPCAKLCKPLELLPVVLWQQTYTVNNGVYASVAYIQNPNLDAQAFNVPYTFKMYDSTNTLLAERKGTTQIPPGRTFAVFESGIAIQSGTPSRTEFIFSNEYDWQVARSSVVLKIENITINESASPSIEADLVNPTYSEVTDIAATVIVYDELGVAIAASKTYVEYLGKQSRARLVYTWPKEFVKIPTRIEIIPVIHE